MALLSCLIHESRHCVTAAYDYDRKFVGKAEEDILHLLMLLLGRKSDLDGNPISKAGDADAIRPNIVRPLIFVDENGKEILTMNLEDLSGPAESSDDPCFDELLRIEKELLRRPK
jgi:hypothetical protein